VKTSSVALAVTASDRVSTPHVQLTLDGTEVYNGLVHSTRTFTMDGLTEGTHTIACTATDKVGHSTTQTQSFLVDSSSKLGDNAIGPGAEGTDVKQLQSMLRKNHVYDGERTGVYDAATEEAVRTFQRRMEMKQTGVADLDTIAALTGRIVVDQSSLRLYFYYLGKLKFVFPVATGMPAYPTPNGLFHVVVMSKDPTWIPPDSPWAKGLEPIPAGPGNPLGTRWIGTSAPGVGIHGTPADWSIGTHASHGCIRMHIWQVEQLYEYVKVGMPVLIKW